MRPLKINNSTYLYDQQKIPIEKIDIPAWLQRQQIYPKVYWKDRDSKLEHAALGNILCLSQIPRLDDDGIRFYGGMQFPLKQSDDLWEPFAPCAFWLPSFEVIQSDERTELILHSVNAKASLVNMEKLQWGNASSERALPLLLRQDHSISLEKWKMSIAHLLDAIQQGRLQKVVIGRKTTLSFSNALCGFCMIHKLKERALNATLFVFQLSPDHAFLGASPEKLFSRKGKEVLIDAVAGTRKRGKDAAEDLLLQEELRADAKETYEFNAVKEFIQHQTAPLAEECFWLNNDAVLKTAHVQHLYNQARMRLKEGYLDEALLLALHPTPAVGGSPQKAALELIDQWESFQRGWYASPVGWVSSEETQLAVAIRSGLVTKCALHLFAGAGIVSQSIAEKEWEEIDHKMRLLLYGCGLA